MTSFSKIIHKVIAVKGAMISVRGPDGKEFTRYASKFKKRAANTESYEIEERLADIEEEEGTLGEPETIERSEDRRPVAVRRSERNRLQPDRLKY